MMKHKVHGRMVAVRRDERGMALLLTLFVLLILIGGVAAMAIFAWNEDRLTEHEENRTKSFYGAEAGIALAEGLVWNDYVEDVAGNRGLIPAYQAWADMSAVPVGTTTLAAGAFGVPAGQIDGATRLLNVQITRTDSIANTLYAIQSTGQDRFGNPRVLTEHLMIQSWQDSALQYGIMGRNMECLFCHAEIDNVLRVMNTRPSRFGTFERVRVAALGYLVNADPDATNGINSFDTRLAGTLYTRGAIANDPNGSPMTTGQLNASDFNTYQFDPATQYIQEDGAGNPTAISLDQAATIAGVLETDANLYTDYPTVPADQTDGIVPDDMPPPITDTNGNLIIDSADMDALLARIQADVGVRSPGSVSGGIILNTAIGGTYNSGNLPGAGNMAAIDTAASGKHVGNVIMVGTPGSPLMLDNTVVIEGDLVISGVTQGEGQIYVSGNVYVIGDLTYNDGPIWGTAANGQSNMLVIRAGGNILTGDFLTPQRTYTFDPNDPITTIVKRAPGDAVAIIDNLNAIDTGNHLVPPPNAPPNGLALPGGAGAPAVPGQSWWGYGMEQVVYYNRHEWTFTQQKLQKQGGTPGGTGGANLVVNGSYDAAYNPLYLTMGPGDPVYIFALEDDISPNPGAQTNGTYWSTVQNYWRGNVRPVDYTIHEDVVTGGVAGALDAMGQLATGAPNGNGSIDAGEDMDGDGVLDTGPLLMLSAADVATQGGAVIYLTPTNGWITDKNLKSFWVDDNAARPWGQPVTIEAGLHAYHTLMAITRNGSRYGRNSRGQITVNGFLQARNVSILAPADQGAGVMVGMRMHFDPRLIQFAEGITTNPVAATRLAMEYN